LTAQSDAARTRLEELEDRPRRSGFAAATLANKAKRLGRLNPEADAIDGVHVAPVASKYPAAHLKRFVQGFYFEQRNRRNCTHGERSAEATDFQFQQATK
jgi:hypothetical protein